MSIYTTPAGINKNPRTLQECIRNWQMFGSFAAAGPIGVDPDTGQLTIATELGFSQTEVILDTTGFIVTADSNGTNLTNPIDGSSAFPPGHSNTFPGSWIKIDMLSNRVVKKLEWIGTSSNTVPPHYKIEYSTDNTNWTTAITGLPATIDTTYEFPLPVTARYIRYTCDDSTPNGNWVLFHFVVTAIALGTPAIVTGSPLVKATAGTVIRISGAFKKFAAGDEWRLTIGDAAAANGYRLVWTGAGVVKLQSVAATVGTDIGSTAALTSDTNLHYVHMFILVLAHNDVSIVCQIDGSNSVHVENNATYDLTAAANTISPFTGDITKLWAFGFTTSATVNGPTGPYPIAAVTSVGLTAPSFLTVGGSPVTSSGNLSLTLANQTQNTVFAAPNGSNGTPTFRALASADLANGIVGLSQLGALTTKGDVLGFGTSHVRIPVGSDGQIITADSSQTAGIKWAANGGVATALTFTASTTGAIAKTSWSATWGGSVVGGSLANAWDGSTAASLVLGSPSGNHFVLNLGATYTLSRVKITSQATTVIPTSYTIEVSPNNVTYTLVSNSVTASVVTDYFFPSNQAGMQYVRITPNSGTSNGNWFVNELDVFGGGAGAAADLTGAPTLTPVAGNFLRISGAFKKNSSGDDWRMLVGDATAANGYRVNWTSAGILKLQRLAAGVATDIGSNVTLTSDTNLHYLHALLMINATNDVSMLCQIDGTSSVHVDNDTVYSLVATDTVTVFTGDVSKLWGFGYTLGTVVNGPSGDRALIANDIPATLNNTTIPVATVSTKVLNAGDGNTFGAMTITNVSNATVPLVVNGITGTVGLQTWKSNGTLVASIDQNGTVTGGKIIVGDGSTLGNGTTMGNTTISNLTATNITASGGNVTNSGGTTLSGNVTMSGTTATVSAALTISNATTTHGVGDSNSTTLSVAYDPSVTAGNLNVWQNSGFTITLPTAGTYRVFSNVRCQMVTPALATGKSNFVLARLFNSTDNAVVTDSDRMVIYVANPNAASQSYNMQITTPLETFVTVAASKTLRLEILINGDQAATLVEIATSSAGKTTLGYQRVA